MASPGQKKSLQGFCTTAVDNIDINLIFWNPMKVVIKIASWIVPLQYFNIQNALKSHTHNQTSTLITTFIVVMNAKGIVVQTCGAVSTET